MNPWDLDATGLLIWGIVAHLVADWPLQNDWMANNKAKRREAARYFDGGGYAAPGEADPWFDRHPAAYVHAGIHGILLALVFGWVAAPLALVHLVIDCRWPVARWSRLMRQTQPQGLTAWINAHDKAPMYDVGLEVRFWTDQVFHIATIAVAALLVGGLS